MTAGSLNSLEGMWPGRGVRVDQRWLVLIRSLLPPHRSAWVRTELDLLQTCLAAQAHACLCGGKGGREAGVEACVSVCRGPVRAGCLGRGG